MTPLRAIVAAILVAMLSACQPSKSYDSLCMVVGEGMLACKTIPSAE
jgi:hypothetical protein